MARAIPGTAEILAIYGQRPQRSTQYQASPYQKRQQVHPLATLETVIESPLTDLAVTAISRGMDEYDYYQRKSAEEDRVKAENQGRNEQVGQLRSQIEELDSKLGAIPPEAIERAKLYTGPEEAYSLGQIGTTQGPGPPGSPHGQFQVGAPIGGVAQPTEGGWGDYSFSNIQQMLSERHRLQEAEGNIAPAAKARFTPRTQQEFIQAMRAASPEERQVLMQQARNAVDMQPDSLQDAFAGTAGRKTQTAVAKATSAYDAAVAKAAADETEAGRMERETQVKEEEHTSKDAKRQAEIKKLEAQEKKINAEAKKLAKQIEKIARRAKAGSVLRRDTQTLYEIAATYGGDTLPEMLKNAYGSGAEFQDKLKEAIPKTYARVYQTVLNSKKAMLKSSGRGTTPSPTGSGMTQDEERKILPGLMEDVRNAQGRMEAAQGTIDAAIDDKSVAKANAELARASSDMNQASTLLAAIRNPEKYGAAGEVRRRPTNAVVDVPGVGPVGVTLGRGE